MDKQPVTNGHSAEPVQRFEDEVRQRLTALEALLDVVARLSCPVCAPAVVAQNHPEVVRTDVH